jgi:hypothetical protein
MNAKAILDRQFLEMRCKLIELAAGFDRLDRASGAGEIAADPRLAQLRRGLAMLTDGEGDRAGRIQMLFSDEYDADWARP